jgi:hypothetical protein
VPFLLKNLSCALDISRRKNIHMSDITWLTLFFAYPYQKDMHIPYNNYDADEKSRIWLLISNEQQHKGTFTRTQNVKILLERLRR